MLDGIRVSKNSSEAAQLNKTKGGWENASIIERSIDGKGLSKSVSSSSQVWYETTYQNRYLAVKEGAFSKHSAPLVSRERLLVVQVEVAMGTAVEEVAMETAVGERPSNRRPWTSRR